MPIDIKKVKSSMGIPCATVARNRGFYRNITIDLYTITNINKCLFIVLHCVMSKHKKSG